MHDKTKIRPFFERRTVLTTLFIGITYLWTADIYLSWTSHLSPLASDTVTYLSTEAGGCFMQVIGILLYAWLLKSKKKLALHIRFLVASMLLDGCFILPILFCDTWPPVLAAGMIMNLFHGIIAAYYVTLLAYFVPAGRRASCFGIGYAIGSLGSYLLSLAEEKWHLGDGFICLVYAVFIFLSIAALSGAHPDACAAECERKEEQAAGAPFPYLLSGMVIVLFGLTSQLLFFFPAMTYISNTADLKFSHMFYAVGLILAAIVNDKKRNAGLVLALLSLCFPLLSLALYQFSNLHTPLSVLGYSVMGFYAVYRIVVFADLYDRDCRLLFLCQAGLFCGKFGEAAGSVSGYVIGSRHIALALITVLLFVISTILAFLLYVKLYAAHPVTAEDKTNRFYAAYKLSVKEQEVFALLAEGKTNKEIADALFISENTVKFHMKNILKKTDCQKRTDVIHKFQTYKP